ncbi:hypothetical protein K457DRAFT_587706 [Linnemannia elongata AG-77]|uniref:Uncharacterized protein n=1 Tax=Linnemannia elongata AG-77 TaxID=1314771 RepID=A0A197JT87_9FUNG|nr:hypothetical protein K457DRAFT_587706 [Linnemannia elongata AG-77]
MIFAWIPHEVAYATWNAFLLMMCFACGFLYPFVIIPMHGRLDMAYTTVFNSFFLLTAEDPTLPTPFRPTRSKMRTSLVLRIVSMFAFWHHFPRSLFLSYSMLHWDYYTEKRALGRRYGIYRRHKHQDGSRRQLYHHKQTAKRNEALIILFSILSLSFYLCL